MGVTHFIKINNRGWVYEGSGRGVPLSIFSSFSKCFRAFFTFTNVAAEAIGMTVHYIMKGEWFNLRIVGSERMTIT